MTVAYFSFSLVSSIVLLTPWAFFSFFQRWFFFSRLLPLMSTVYLYDINMYMVRCSGLSVLWECMCSIWLCGFEQRIRIRKIYIFLVISAHFSFDIVHSFWHLGDADTSSEMGNSRAYPAAPCDLTGCELSLSMGMRMKLMLCYHSIFHSLAIFHISSLSISLIRVVYCSH